MISMKQLSPGNMPAKRCLAMVIFLALAVLPSNAQIVGSNDSVLFEPESAFIMTEYETIALTMTEYESIALTWFTNITENIDRVVITTENTYNSEVTSYTQPMSYADDLPEAVNVTRMDGDVTYYGELNITAIFVGFNELRIQFFDKDNESIAIVNRQHIVLLKGQALVDIFSYSAAVIIGILYFFMGATLDLVIVKNIFKKPVGPFLGIFCQYGIMPAVSFGLGLLFFPDDVSLRLGLFLNGCCPGGGQSNMWTHLLGGSLDLSIMMTSISTMVAFGAVPLWVLTVGPIIAADGNFVIPFMEIVTTVIGLIFPCVVGIVVQIFFPRIIKISQKVLTPFSVFILAYIFSFGLYAYRYTLYIMTWKSILAGFMLPFLGYVFGIVLARIFRQSWKNAIAVGIETGVQNTTVTIIILTVAIPRPTSTIAAVIPATNTLFTPVPLLIALIIKHIYIKIYASKTGEIASSTTNLKELPAKTSTTEQNGKSDKYNKHEINVQGEGGITNPAADLRDVL